MTVTFGVTVTGVSTDGGGSATVTSSSGRRVLAAKTDSVSNVNNNNNNNNTMHNNNNGPAGPSSITGKASVLSVRRVLFGPPADPAETRAWLDRQLCAAATSESRAWNFDFVNERPLRDSPADRYLWERVCLPTPPAQQQQPQRHEQQQQVDQRVCAVHRTRQSKVTDFMKQTKKRSLNAMMTAGSLKSNNKKVADGDSPATANKRSRRSIVSTMAI